MNTLERVLSGAIAGAVATVPMTAVMERLFHDLPAHQRSPLPPRPITQNAARTVNVERHLTAKQLDALTLASHFGYGSATGAVLGLLSSAGLPLAGPVGGSVWGVTVWAGSYLGWLPAAGLHRSATREPAERNRLMLAAHVVWGAAAGTLLSAFANGSSK